ncbi:MAG: two-component system sensor histidine kinase FlrB [Pseudohongiellaceae bacterium]|jgi:two-component system sensor histidine kinase FlrB
MEQQKPNVWKDDSAFNPLSQGAVSRVVLEAKVSNQSVPDVNSRDFVRQHNDTAIESIQVQSLFDHDVFSTTKKIAPADQALSLFDQLSSQLTSSYRNLENKVTQLKDELSEEEMQRGEELKEKEKIANRLSTLLEILPAGVVLLDGKGSVTETNPAALDLLGEPLEGEAWLDVITRCFSPRHDDGHEVSLKDGRRVRIETRSMSSGSGQLILLSDLTETRLLQEQVSRAERLSSLGKMVASLAHQIRTPLSTAMLYAGHLCQPEIEPKLRVECADKLLSRLSHLEHQIRDMLIFAKGETRLVEHVNISEILSSLRAAADPVLDKAGVVCYWESNVVDKHVMCNKETLVGACLNLINNSIEAAEQHKNLVAPLAIHVSVSMADEHTIKLQIKDNGPGIPSEHRSKVFEPFYTTKAQGTGLGLAVVQAVVKAHQGDFKVRSSKKGVSASITLPVFNVTAKPKV